MKIGFTSFRLVVVVALQWIAAIYLIRMGQKYQILFADFGATLPDMSVIALQATKPVVLVPIVLATTLVVVVAEAMPTSAASRIVIQTGVFAFWFAFICLCIIALVVPLFTIVEKLRQ